MPTTYSTPTKTARRQAVIDTIGSGGKLKLLTSADAVLATFALASPAGVAAAGTLTLSDANGGSAGLLSTTASAAGVAAKAIITTSADVSVITGLTVGTSGADIVLDNTNIASGQSVTINTGALAHG